MSAAGKAAGIKKKLGKADNKEDRGDTQTREQDSQDEPDSENSQAGDDEDGGKDDDDDDDEADKNGTEPEEEDEDEGEEDEEEEEEEEDEEDDEDEEGGKVHDKEVKTAKKKPAAKPNAEVKNAPKLNLINIMFHHVGGSVRHSKLQWL